MQQNKFAIPPQAPFDFSAQNQQGKQRQSLGDEQNILP